VTYLGVGCSTKDERSQGDRERCGVSSGNLSRANRFCGSLFCGNLFVAIFFVAILLFLFLIAPPYELEIARKFI
jgi:hypothetical protein